MRENSESSVACHHRVGFLGLLITLGIVFGDIGTSPLYVMKAILHTGEAINESTILGALSCIIWTLTLQTTIKYVCVALRADNNGEGGILALYALLRKMKRKWIYLLAIIGASTLLADGIITPAITVTTAIEGLESISPHLPVIPITLGIITIIFFVQRFGTESIGKSFGVFMLIWFLLLGVTGAFSITSYPLILKAFNPYYAAMLLAKSPEWFLILGAVFLCTTGAEALYSDLGHCGRKNITISWLFVKAMLILNYLGQGAWVLNHIQTASSVNPFFSIMPQNMLIFAIIMATGAAIVASQALISGTFSILSEAMNLHFWPRMRIKHPTHVKGQLYIPVINRAMYIGVVLIILLFRDSSHMEAAYGLAITITMLMTTLLLGFYLRTKGVARIFILLFMGAYCVIEGIFLAANLSKFLAGGWCTMLIGGILFLMMYVWVHAIKIRHHYISTKPLNEYYQIISDIKADESIPKYASNLVYVNHAEKEGAVDDKLLYSIINKQPKRADHYWLINLEFADTPDTLEYSCETLVPDTLYSVTMRIGFRIEPRVSLYLRQVVEDLVTSRKVDLRSTYPSLRKNGIPGDFRFIIIHRVYYPESSDNRQQNLLMTIYALIGKIGIDEPKALGLDTSMVVVERVPLIINHCNRNIRRIMQIVEE
ncbi:KUP/HAK/KT family potassium transporter [Segatella copri]|uniref:Probable potassium transport system protein Kup n=2 Tax=Segatella copri TaxID=165179 RepID=A0A6G1VRU2_9BACT|nr:KUP/HAK/KT family potassium transporter [Segatella copri]MQN61284.1 KUP/HAK/KT family potassium transporter [Segatella copri]MQP15361.1 KUP/HAK/KT family potassium transporter [Segatella copri]